MKKKLLSNVLKKIFGQMKIDIYPTILDMMGYNKPFRSCGRSLFDTKQVKPFVMNYMNNQYQCMCCDYICTFYGSKNYWILL